ncbi:alpha/beta fold hydrolase [Vibrio tapetis]|uniref:Hydrolase, alpha/beta fold family n=1 Tax=Vibrio tapetis subsp. tapetis TaxID=1671868 RepID=A0A2N8ZJ53_9VIBR|nr:alpha/beta hydrolase [Vibrio tapetis]SON51935.1 Hydrolase, alpha/beta fold family [Vibrio tapetis subsp. tapetis]
MEVVSLNSKNSRVLRVRVWWPVGPIKQAVVLSHGMAEHIDRYEELANWFTRTGTLLCGINHRGHGEEAEQLGHFSNENGWQYVLDDLDCVVDYAFQALSLLKAELEIDDPRPVLIGHSMGSFIARHYAVLNGKKLSGLVLCGSNHQSPLLFQIGRIAARVESWRIGNNVSSPLLEKLSFGNANKGIRVVRTEQDWLSRDENMVDAYIQDPYCGFTCTAQFWIDFLGGLAEISKDQAFDAISNDLAILVIGGEADPITRYGVGTSALVDKLNQHGCSKTTYYLYQDARHELFNETNRESIMKDVQCWLTSLNT